MHSLLVSLLVSPKRDSLRRRPFSAANYLHQLGRGHFLNIFQHTRRAFQVLGRSCFVLDHLIDPDFLESERALFKATFSGVVRELSAFPNGNWRLELAFAKEK